MTIWEWWWWSSSSLSLSSSSSSSSPCRWWMQQQQPQRRQDVDGWWWSLFHSIKFIWIEYGQIYSNDSAFKMLVIYCGYQIYFTYQHTTTIAVKQSQRPWIIGSWYHIGKSRQCIKIFTYIMDVLHMFSTSKTGDSHINRLQTIQYLIVI